jgi:hypothetical protein
MEKIKELSEILLLKNMGYVPYCVLQVTLKTTRRVGFLCVFLAGLWAWAIASKKIAVIVRDSEDFDHGATGPQCDIC